MGYLKIDIDKERKVVTTDVNFLDNCAYEILCRLYSTIEPEIEKKIKALAQGFIDKKNSANSFGKRISAAFSIDAAGSSSSSSSLGGDNTFEKIVEHLAEIIAKKKREYRPDNAYCMHFRNKARSVAVSSSAVDDEEATGALKLREYSEIIKECVAKLVLQNEPGMQCVAVMLTRSRDLYVCANGMWGVKAIENNVIEVPSVEVMDVQNPHSEYGGNGYEIPWFKSNAEAEVAVKKISTGVIANYALRSVVFLSPVTGDFEGKFHAEMQLLEYCLLTGVRPLHRYIGVSKPCCQQCATKLDRAGLLFPRDERAIAGVAEGDLLRIVGAGGYGQHLNMEKLTEYRESQGV